MGAGKSASRANSPGVARGAGWTRTGWSARRAGMPIPEIFARQGEEGFRRLETEALRSLTAAAG